jgi:GNAT superfamily N-acetyltransferase
MSPFQLSFVHIDPGSAEMFCPGFVETFREAFGGPPYYEHYEPEEVVRDIWEPHLASGLITVALDMSRVIGFGCALPFAAMPEEVRAFLTERHGDGSLQCELDRLWYMSELGVRPPYRGHNIGYHLIRHRLRQIGVLGGSHYAVRTAAEGSNSSHMYESIDATPLPGRQDVSATAQVVDNKSQSTERVYFYGSCIEGLMVLSNRLTD